MAPSLAAREQLVTPVVPAAGKRQKTSPVAAETSPSQPQPWLKWALVAAAVVASAGAGWWWHSRPKEPIVAAVPPAATVPPLSPAQVAGNSALPRITGLRHWANAESSTVVIDLQDQVPYEIHRLSSPDRIFVDLHDTALVQELTSKNDVVDDALLSRIKIGQTVPGVSRVELETKNSSNFSVSLEPNPYRLVLEIRSLQAPPKPKMDTQTVMQNPPHPTFPEISKNPSAEDAKLRAHVPHLRIVVDAGHGGWDMGTVGRQGLLEKDLALEIAQRLGVLLEQRLGLEVIYTRTDDTFVPLGRRAAIANQVGADLFISVHANYSSMSAARGVETYYTSDGPSTQVLAEEEKEVGSAPELQMAASDLRNKSDASRKLATSVQQSLYGSLAAKSPGVRNRGVKAASFVVLTGTTMPAILAEVSFVSSPADEHNLQDPFYRQNIAEALYRGVARYAANSAKTNVASTSKRNTGL
jgi:N-acetylmuramoyl-L-alanine amidase